MNQKITKITVLTPHYRSKELYRTIQSVLNQDYPSIQYLVIIDGPHGESETGVTDYLRQNAGTNVEWNVLSFGENKGTVRALNYGLRHATGEVIFNLADDDVFSSDTVLSRWTEYMLARCSLVCTARRGLVYPASGEVCAELPTKKQVQLIQNSSPKLLFEKTSAANLIFGSCTAYSHKCIEKYGFYNEKYRLIEDYPKVMELLRSNVKIDFFDEVVVHCRQNGVSAVQNVSESYMKENDSIFKNEVLPYTDHPLQNGFRYLLWRTKVLRYQRFLKNKDLYAGNFFVQMLNYIGYPENIFRWIRRKG